MHITPFRPLAIVCLAAAMLAGCANDSATLYSRNQVRQVQTVQLGTVVSVNNVRIEGENNPFYTLGGAALGGLAGSTIGGGRGQAAAAIVGALGGGAAANAGQKSMGSQAAYDITVKLDNGTMISIVQAADVTIAVGQRVRVLTGAGADRVMPL